MKNTMLIIVVGLVIFIVAMAVLLVSLLKKGGTKTNYKFTDAQEKHLEQLHPAAQRPFRKLLEAIQEDLGWEVIITSSYRSFAKQASLYAQNNKNARPGRSYHNYGLALDINLRKDGQQLRKASSKQAWEASGMPALARKRGFKWGGDFVNYHDPVHLDWRGYEDIDTLYNKAIEQFGTAWENIQGNQVRNLTVEPEICSL